MRKFIFLKEKRILYRIFIDEILYVESLKDYVYVVLEGKKFIVHTTLSSIPEKIPGFLQISRSQVVNPERIDRIDHPEIHIQDRRFWISDLYKENFYQKIEKWKI